MSNPEENDERAAAANGNAVISNEPSSLTDGGRVTPQLSSGLQLDQDVSPNPSPTQPSYDDHNDSHHHQQQQQQQHNKLNGNNSQRSSPSKSVGDRRNSNYQYNSDNEDDYGPASAAGGGGAVNDYWSQRNGALSQNPSGRQSRAGGAPGAGGSQTPNPFNDNMSENSEQPPVQPLLRSKSRPELSSNAHMNSVMSAASRYSNLSYWKARRVVFYRNGDPFFPGVELRYRPGRDITSLDVLLEKLSPKMDLPRGARYVFSMDGDRKYHLDELEDGASYVVSSFKAFKVSGYDLIDYV